MLIKRCQRSKTKLQVHVRTIQEAQEVKVIELEVLIISKIISYTIVDGSNELNIQLIRIIEKLGLSTIYLSFYVVNMINKSQDTSLGQRSGFRIITNGKKYSFNFHIIHMHLNKNNYLLFLGRF